MVDGYYRIQALRLLQGGKDNDYAVLARTNNRFTLYQTFREDVSPLSAMDIVKDSKLYNNVTGHTLPCCEFLHVLNAILVYTRTFEDQYGFSFQEATLVHIYRDMDSPNVLPSTSDKTYFR